MTGVQTCALPISVELVGGTLGYVDLLEAQYIDGSGQLVSAIDAFGFQEIRAGARTIVVLIFDQVNPGGTVFLPTISPGGSFDELVLPTPAAHFP